MISHVKIKSRFFLAMLAAACICASMLPPDGRAQSRGTVVVDAGHGGFDRGGVPGQRVAEKDKTLDVALRLAAVLRASGYRVVLTRSGDYFVTLGQRVAIANSQSNAIFVSVHFNCASRSGANGIETYYYRGDSSSLAASIHRNVVAGAPSENRGIRRRGFFVIRRTSIPSVLVECGFLTNPTEASLAQSPSYRQKLAEEIARGIMRQPAPMNRPISRASSVSSEVLPQPFVGADFVRAAPASERSRSSRTSHSKKSSHHKSSKKKSGKKSDDDPPVHKKKKVSSSDDDTPKPKKKKHKPSED